MTATYVFHTTVQSAKGNHSAGLVAHTKHTLTHPTDRDVVLCLIVRKHIEEGTTIDELHATAKLDSEVVEPLLRKIARDTGWLES